MYWYHHDSSKLVGKLCRVSYSGLKMLRTAVRSLVSSYRWFKVAALERTRLVRRSAFLLFRSKFRQWYYVYWHNDLSLMQDMVYTVRSLVQLISYDGGVYLTCAEVGCPHACREAVDAVHVSAPWYVNNKSIRCTIREHGRHFGSSHTLPCLNVNDCAWKNLCLSYWRHSAHGICGGHRVIVTGCLRVTYYWNCLIKIQRISLNQPEERSKETTGHSRFVVFAPPVSDSVLFLCWSLEENLQVTPACLMNVSALLAKHWKRDGNCKATVMERSDFNYCDRAHACRQWLQCVSSFSRPSRSCLQGSVAVSRVHSLHHIQSWSSCLFIMIIWEEKQPFRFITSLIFLGCSAIIEFTVRESAPRSCRCLEL